MSKPNKKQKAKRRWDQQQARQAKHKQDQGVLESLMHEYLDSITGAIYSMAEVCEPGYDGPMNQCRSLKGLLAVAMVESARLEDDFAHHKQRTPLNVRHLAVQKIVSAYIQECLEDEDMADLANRDNDEDVSKDPVAIMFFKSTHKMLRAIHSALHIKSTRAARDGAVSNFTSQVGWG